MSRLTLRWFLMMVLVAFTASCVLAGAVDELPLNPFLADSPWPMSHRHPFNQGSSPHPGPVASTEAKPQLLPGSPVSITLAISESYDDGQRAMWGTTMSYLFKLDANGGQLDYISKFPRQQSRSEAISGAYSLIDCDGGFYVPRGPLIEVFCDAEPGQLHSPIKKDRQFQLPIELASDDELIVGINMTFDGRIVFVTDSGIVGSLSRELDDFEYVRLQQLGGDPVHVSNSIAVDDEGRIIVVTDGEIVCVKWDALADERLVCQWRAAYRSADFRMTGRLGKGSGTTPSLLGFGEQDKLVAIGDGQQLMNVVLVWRADIPDDWEGLPGRDRRIAAELPVTFGQPEAERSTTEQSLTVCGHEIAAVSNRYGELPPIIKRFVRRRMGNDVDIMTIFRSNSKSVAPFGVQKFSWEEDQNELRTVWVRPDLSCPNGIPTMSAATGLMYFIGQRDSVWTLEAVRWDTGESVFHSAVSNNSDNNSFYAATEIGDGGSVLTGTYGGVLRFSATDTESISQRGSSSAHP